MFPPRVLVLNNQRFQRSVLIKMLDHLGVHDVVQANSGEQALLQMQQSGGVDIVLCDLADRSLDCLGFLGRAAQSGMVRAVGLCSELAPEMRRTLEQMGSLSGLLLLGVMQPPLQLRALRNTLQCYAARRPLPVPLPSVKSLPSEEEIHRALALGEFRAWFQPQLVMSTGELAGVEALVRWEHPVRGVLLPEDFLAAVLAYDLLDEMFKQLLEQGLSLIGVLRRKEVQLGLAFNLHASQLINTDLVAHIQRSLDQLGFPGHTLTFELAENGLLDISPLIQENLLRLRMLGCGLSIDGFGAGFSSLKLLCRLPFNQLKLDGEFVRHMGDSRGEAMVSSTLALARSLEMSLVIDGVSSQIIRDEVVRLGCTLGQGYFLASPMPAYRLLPWLEARIAQAYSPST